MDPLTLSGLAFAGVTAASLVALNLAPIRVRRVGRWEHPPDVLVTAAAPVEMGDVQHAVDFWRSLGFDIGKVRRRPPAFENTGGVITIDTIPKGWRPVEGEAARADWSVEPVPNLLEDEDWVSHASDILGSVADGFIRTARIEVEPPPLSRDMRLLLAHELGHAMGFLHVSAAPFGWTRRGRPRLKIIGEKTGHLMNPRLSRSGWLAAGLTPDAPVQP